MAALEACNAGKEVYLFDANQVVGKKLLVTGSGRCNLSNTKAAPGLYYSSSEKVLNAVFEQCDQRQLIQRLHQLGILTCATDDGWCYPVSYSAANVVNILQAHLVESGAKLRLAHKINRIIPQSKGFLLKFETGQPAFFVDRLLVAAGGKAYPALGSDGSIFSILQELGHQIVPVRPALAPLLVEPQEVKSFQGVRLDAHLRLFANSELIGESAGNIIFNKGSINGPGAMDLSYLASQYTDKKLELEIDFLVSQKSTLHEILRSFHKKNFSLQALLGAVVPNKIVSHVLKQMRLPDNSVISQLTEKQIKQAIIRLSSYRLGVKGVGEFSQSQLSTGGISLTEIHPSTLESKLVKGLFFAGEVLDVVGPCGGYNLQWAFSSGVIAGRSSVQG